MTGCADGLVCAPNNNKCVECYEDSHCGADLQCQGFRCEGPGAQCAACDGDWKCQGGTSCQDLPEGGAACLKSCNSDSSGNACDAGFTCQGGRCLPDAARFEGCYALGALNTSCNSDAMCRDQGLTDGVCVDSACTVPCTTNKECPGSMRCEDSAAGRVCRPRN
ncbi:hypothetical protein [Pyxidicoccus fallax]|uniref:hypothetical protein n=1 Tax=Pyxidicoccus fallax TaxID=394095 RepID=UPI001FE6AD59|nr:hypothetical protein [Pyxidicoccus fallax]